MVNIHDVLQRAFYESERTLFTRVTKLHTNYILIWYSYFESVTTMEPSDKYENLTNHTFHAQVSLRDTEYLKFDNLFAGDDTTVNLMEFQGLVYELS